MHAVVDNSDHEGDEEDQADYRPGGFHPVAIGDEFNERFVNHVLGHNLNLSQCFFRYIVKSKLGWGAFSTVWRCWDTKLGCFLAVKVLQSKKDVTVMGRDEIKLLRSLGKLAESGHAGKDHVLKLMQDFKVSCQEWVNALIFVVVLMVIVILC